MNNQIKRDLVSKVLKLNKIQQTEVFNIIRKENINYTCNNNGIFINLTKIDIRLINKINTYIDYLKNNQENLNKIEDYCNNITTINDNDGEVYKIINFDEFKDLKNIKFLENIRTDLNLKRKKEIHSKFINTTKKYQRLLFINYEMDNLNDLSKEKNLIKN
tara:strand:- start:6363 stop:6845 length:483 start_codon:yes stop_codon:yes gene_type:complete